MMLAVTESIACARRRYGARWLPRRRSAPPLPNARASRSEPHCLARWGNAQLERESLDEHMSDGFRPRTIVRRDQQPDEIAKRRLVARRQLERSFRRGGRFVKPTGPLEADRPAPTRLPWRAREGERARPLPIDRNPPRCARRSRRGNRRGTTAARRTIALRPAPSGTRRRRSTRDRATVATTRPTRRSHQSPSVRRRT